MAKGKQKQVDNEPRIANRKARFDYHIEDSFEVGIKLTGSEVKSVRAGQVNITEGYCAVEKDGNLYLLNAEISPYSHAGPATNHSPRRARRLLAHRREINRLIDATNDKGTTIVPLAMYFTRGMVKVEIGVAKGKKQHDKRQDIKKRDADRQIRRAMARKVL